jgi:hypothetical protein
MPIIASPALQQQQFALQAATGHKRNASTYTLVPAGLEAMYLAFKQFPVPFLSPSGEAAEVAVPGGGATYVATPPDTRFTGGITLMETTSDVVRNFVNWVVAQGGYFDATIYDGTIDAHRGGWKIVGAFFKLDNFDADAENRTQIVTPSGTIWFNYFGASVPPLLV